MAVVTEKCIIGTRGSALARRQTELISELLMRAVPGIRIDVKIIKTEGDKNLSPIPLDTIGKRWFTKEIERELESGSIDIAVHSLKDMSADSPPGLTIAAYPLRADAREVLVSRSGSILAELPQHAVIGSDSFRRKSQIQEVRADLRVESVRGNIQTRLSKLDNGEYDALVLAAAGLIRLELQSRITEYFPSENFVPAPGQGILCVQTREDDPSVRTLADRLNNRDVELCARAERTFSAAVGGGCKTPVGAYAELESGTLKLIGYMGDRDGRWAFRDTLFGRAESSDDIGRTLAMKMLSRAGRVAAS